MRENGPGPQGCLCPYADAALLAPHLELPDFVARALPGRMGVGNATIG